MKNDIAKFMMNEIDERLAKRKRPLWRPIQIKLDNLRKWINMDMDLNAKDSEFLIDQHFRATELKRIKW